MQTSGKQNSFTEEPGNLPSLPESTRILGTVEEEPPCPGPASVTKAGAPDFSLTNHIYFALP